MTLQERLVYAREHSGLSMAQAAVKLGVARSAVWRWETGKNEPETKYLASLAEIYGVSKCWLTFGELNTNVSQDLAPLLASKSGQAKKDLEDIINLLSTLDYTADS